MDKKIWQKYFESYDVLARVIPYQELLDSVVAEAGVKDGDLVLDAGCGTGNLAVRLSEKGAWVVGLDNRREAINAYQRKDPLAQVTVHDLLDPLPFVDGTFDTVCCNNVLYSIDPARRGELLLEFKRVLKKGGTLIVANPHINMNPAEVWKEHFYRSLEREGFLKAASKNWRLLRPAVSLSYYGYLVDRGIKVGKHSLFSYKEQEKMLEDLGFKVLKSLMVYADQGVLVRAER